MRKFLLLPGLAALLLLPAYGLTQFPSRPAGPSGGAPPGAGAPGSGTPGSRFGGDFRSRFSRGAPGQTPGSPAAPSQPGNGSQPGSGKSFGKSFGGQPGSGSPSFGRGPSTPGGGMPPGGGDARPSMPSEENMIQFAQEMFRRRDRNGDGLLNFDEMTDSLQSERDKWDMNRDGFIDLNEYGPYFQGRLQQQMQERGEFSGSGGYGGYVPDPPPRPPEDEPKPVVYRTGKLPRGLPSWFSELDKDIDAQVGLYEWKDSGKTLDEFKSFDRNDDGFVTVAEVLWVSQNTKSGSSGSLASNGSSRSGLGNIFGMFGRRSSSGDSSSSGSSRSGGSGRGR